MKTICVTGAGAGIGRATLMHFHGAGWHVIGLDKDAEALAELRSALPRESALLLTCDVGKEGDVTRSFARIEDWLDGAALDCLVNNAGIADPYCGPLEGLALSDWQAWIDASLTAAFLCSRAAVQLLRRAETGASIVNISSTRAVMSEPECFAYASAKGGLDALTHAMAVSLGPEIRINAIRPGWIETGPWQKTGERREANHREKDCDQHPAGRVGTPQDIAEAVEYLHGAGFITGQHLNVDGGMTRKMIYED
ncbi:SDR family oxidoreductase [Qipengyuania sp. XHP0211]|uniref:SDR family NAD(P)-dependent oxidoreductase n=1 Tax=Qipengyuania sp. XHP0211 TaxID=3038079 RepID=UPI00241CDB61|nr:SDR family oxidoreductase [Qipengyuania sp. XHP0211]MDG5752174.1 SDR family oxidoreductase [Qipengyuania sp. XHP0211]